MKHHGKIHIGCLFIFTWIALTFFSSAWPQEHKPIKEEITVTNVEVPVRVLDKGKAIGDLTKEDFILYESNKKMEINGFFIKRRKISIRGMEEAAKDTGNNASLPGPPPPPRMFVLAFNITSYNRYFQEAVDHLFDKILKPTDRVIMFANDITREYRHPGNMSRFKQQIIDDLKKESMKARRRLINYINRLEMYLKTTTGVSDKMDTDTSLVNFLQRYLMAWNEYKRQYLTPRVDHFYYFARFLEKIKGEKYVLNFYQFELFPRIRVSSQTMQKIRDTSNLLSNTNDGALIARGHLLNNLLNQLLSDYDLNKGFPNEEIAKLFYKVDATFNSFFIKASNAAMHNEFEYRTLASDLERVLKSITDITGGKNITSNDLVKSLDTVSEIEDVYYILTYTPLDPNKAGKLKIKVKNRGYKVYYDNNFRADYIDEYLEQLEEKIKTPEIKIEKFSFDRKILAFAITGYLLKQVDEKTIGRMKIGIKLTDRKGNRLFDQEKMLTAQEDHIVISLPTFKELGKGEYNILIDARDLFTGKEANLYREIAVK